MDVLWMGVIVEELNGSYMFVRKTYFGRKAGKFVVTMMVCNYIIKEIISRATF